MSGFGDYFSKMAQQNQANMPANMQQSAPDQGVPLAGMPQGQVSLYGAPSNMQMGIPEGYAQQSPINTQNPAMGAGMGGAAAWPGFGQGGMPGGANSGGGQGYEGFNQPGGGGISPGGGFGSFGNFNFGPGSYSPWSAGSMPQGGGSAMTGGQPAGGAADLYNQQTQQLSGVDPNNPLAPAMATTQQGFTPIPAPPKPVVKKKKRLSRDEKYGGGR